MSTITNADITRKFFSVTDAPTKSFILANIADHYGITSKEAEAEVLGAEAESLLDYVTGTVRTATHLLLKRHGLA